MCSVLDTSKICGNGRLFRSHSFSNNKKLWKTSALQLFKMFICEILDKYKALHHSPCLTIFHSAKKCKPHTSYNTSFVTANGPITLKQNKLTPVMQDSAAYDVSDFRKHICVSYSHPLPLLCSRKFYCITRKCCQLFVAVAVVVFSKVVVFHSFRLNTY